MMAAVAGTRPLEELLAAASARIARLEPRDAFEAAERGALIIDIRSHEARQRGGIVPGSVHIPRTVLEWRIAPDSESRNPHIGAPEQRLVLLCDHGYSTVLAAAALVDLGFTSAGDVIGGFVAWKEAGLPVAEAPTPLPGLPGMGAPDLV
jgi:rhodanese-related sulfurtransferase